MARARAANEWTDDDRWQAVTARERAADGAFVYAVTSTGIYCRPSCPSRRPRRDRVTYFARPAEAELAGFRACRRCHPAASSARDPWLEKVQRACARLSATEGTLTLASLARELGGSPFHLQRNFKRIVGVTPRAYAEARRLDRAKRGLRAGRGVTDAIFDAGYQTGSRFYERTRKHLGMKPATYRRGGAGAVVRFTLVDSPVGRLLVGATAQGVCAVAMGRSDAELQRALAEEYPAATLVRDPVTLARWTRRVLDHIAGRRPHLDLPLDVQATAFQWQVWEALSAIPYGETRSYRDVARAIGRPTAARAVAGACAANPVALVVPCHRVVPSTGGVGGYRWDPARKRALLDRERGR